MIELLASLGPQQVYIHTRSHHKVGHMFSFANLSMLLGILS